MIDMLDQATPVEAIIVWNDRRFLEFFRLCMPYDPEVAYDLQRIIPFTERVWHGKPDNNWVVHKRWYDLVTELLMNNGYAITIEDGDVIEAYGQAG